MSEFNEAFRFNTQKELAQAAGISEDALSRIIHKPPGWFVYDGRKASVDRTKV
jgi:DNA-binding Lrp family transcriptional regulator